MPEHFLHHGLAIVDPDQPYRTITIGNFGCDRKTAIFPVIRTCAEKPSLWLFITDPWYKSTGESKPMKQAQHRLVIRTNGQELYEITGAITEWLRNQRISEGLLTVFCRHTSASLTIQENADPDVRADLLSYFGRAVEEDPDLYLHGSEGPDDMPAHIRSALTDVSLNIPVDGGRLVLGTWQGVYLFEHRHRPQSRQIILHLMGL
jgi:secondary thiamine-phosphate synthase enzyme